jgi:hypothetical protein
LIAWIVAATALAAGAIDPCAPITSDPAPDPAAATLYRSVGNEERAAGNPDAAATAFRRAAALDPADHASRKALAELCTAARSATPSGAFDRGLALMHSSPVSPTSRSGTARALHSSCARPKPIRTTRRWPGSTWG